MTQIVDNKESGFKVWDKDDWPLFACLRASEWTPTQWIMEDKNGRAIVCEGLVKDNVETKTPYPILALPKGYKVETLNG